MTKKTLASFKRRELLKSLSCAFGVSGDEQAVMEILEGILKKRFHGKKDRFGNRIFSKSGLAKGPRILVAAHSDEIGFMVQSFHPQGYLFFLPIGTWNPLNVIGMPVQVKGAKGLIDGIIGSVPPHHQPGHDPGRLPAWEEMWVDVGARDAEEARERFGLRPGNMIAPFPVFKSISKEQVYMGKAWDDRVGCALLAELLLSLEKNDHPNSIWAVATVQEELGSRGAHVIADRIEADVTFILEGAPADDFPSCSSWAYQASLGKGVQIRSFDPSMVSSPRLLDFLVSLAEKEGIPFQLAVRRKGATDGGPLHRAGTGSPAVVLAVPVRYAHNQVGFIHRADYEACLQLMISACRQLTPEIVSTLFP